VRRSSRYVSITVTASLSFALSASPLMAQDDEPPLQVGVTGSLPSEERKNVTAILNSAEMQRLILEITEKPIGRAELENAVADRFFSVEDMVATGLVREEQGRFHVDFNLLRIEDQHSILEISEQAGRDLAAAFIDRRSDFERLAQGHSQPHTGDAELFFIVLGCFSLDWDGLEMTEARGYRAAAQRTIDGQSFTPWAKEKGASVSLKGLYWGSHNSATSQATFTTFGDHHTTPRFGLPDMLWNIGDAFQQYEDHEDGRQAARHMLSAYANDALDDIGRVMFALQKRDLTVDEIVAATEVDPDKVGPILALLEVAQYVGRYDNKWGSKILVLGPDAVDTVTGMTDIGRQIMIDWHGQNYEQIKSSSSKLTPIRNGVPFERVYTEIWHFVFAIANRTLVAEGFFADPYAEDRPHKGFIPVIWSNGIVESP